MPEVMPDTQANRVLVLLVAADSSAGLGNVLNGRVHIGHAHQQARQATTMPSDDLHALGVLGPDWRGFTDH
jgi:hypothetical protein